MKYLLTLSISLLCFNLSFGQTDTTIDNRVYSIIEKYDNGQLKYIGQFNTTCTDDTLRKHGYFIHFDIEGNEIDKKLYFFDEERNKKSSRFKTGMVGMVWNNNKILSRHKNYSSFYC